MIRVNQIKLPIEHSEQALTDKLLKMLRLRKEELESYAVVKQSVDARRKNELSFVYAADVRLKNEAAFLKKNRNPNIQKALDKIYHFPKTGTETLQSRPIVIGSGPAGLFCAYELAKHGFCPLVIERGMDVDKRTGEVNAFWQKNVLNPKSNVQFGEGGAGTFSDGKLNTLVKDPCGRNREVLELFVSLGAPSEILYRSKPHIGTDILKNVVKNMRMEIERLGGNYIFEQQLTDIEVENGCIKAITVNNGRTYPAEALILAIGHSARDTFELLQQKEIYMEAKSFAVGMRVEHPQSMIDDWQYKGAKHALLPAAAYKLTANLNNGRGVYSFCMCPGGYVVNASSETERLAVNGMSYHARDSKNANSAIIVSVNPADFPEDGPLGGIAFQRELERRAYTAGNGSIPQQLYGDFKENRCSKEYGGFESVTKGKTSFANLRDIFPREISDSFVQGMEQFGTYMNAYNRCDAILSGVESRTSSPVRISRDEHMVSNIAGIYPCGEGAGYAGGIMSAAMDGLKVAEAIALKYKIS